MSEQHTTAQDTPADGRPPFPLPPTFPPGVDPTTYKLKEVEYILNHSAFVNAFATPTAASPDEPIPLPGCTDQSLLGGLRICRQLQRFAIDMMPSPRGIGLRASNAVGPSNATLALHLAFIPDDFYATPWCLPPATPLDFTRSQRFALLDNTITFDQAGQHRLRCFGSGRTFPVVVGGTPCVYLGAIANIMEGTGACQGAVGAYVLNGYLTPPHTLSVQCLIRIVNPTSEMLAVSELSSFEGEAAPDCDATYMTLLGVADPEQPLQQHFGPNGQLQGATVHELLRIIQLDFDAGRTDSGLRTYKTLGPVVAKLRTELRFNPFDPETPGTSLAPVPWGTADTSITFLNSEGHATGTLEANISEGRGFITLMPGAPMPVFRLPGFGPFVKGTGQFEDMAGMFAVNAFISVMPGAFSNLYVFRFVDPDRTLRIH